MAKKTTPKKIEKVAEKLNLLDKKVFAAIQSELSQNDQILDIFDGEGRRLFDKMYSKAEAVFEKYRKEYFRAVGKEQRNSMALPVGCRLYRQNGTDALFVIEQKPQMRTYKVQPEYGNGDDLTYRGDNRKSAYHLAMPFLVYFIRCSRQDNKYVWSEPLEVGCRNEPLQSLKDVIYETVFPNVNDLQVCMPCDNEIYMSRNVSELCDNVIAQFWNTPFSYDGGHLLSGIDCGKMTDLTVWEKESAKNPLFPLKVKWVKYGTVQECMDEYLGDEDEDEDEMFPPGLRKASNMALQKTEDGYDEIESVIQNAAIRALNYAIYSASAKLNAPPGASGTKRKI